jgi:hypothetical protein
VIVLWCISEKLLQIQAKAIQQDELKTINSFIEKQFLHNYLYLEIEQANEND